MRRFFALFSFVFFFFALLPAQNKLTQKEKLSILGSSIERTILEVDPHLNIGIEIVSLNNGLKLYEKNGRNVFVPASCQKLFTTAAALGILGTDFRFDTSLFLDGKIVEGDLYGDLYLKGSGDPSLITDDLEELALQLLRCGVTTIKGDLLIDNFDFDSITQGPGWMWDEGADYWNSALDALLVNHSCINVWVEPGKTVGSSARVTVYPEIEGVTIQNLAKTTDKPIDKGCAKKDELAVARRWMAKENLIEVCGMIEINSTPKVFSVSLESPSLYAALLFRDLLQKHGIALTGEIKYQKVPGNATRIATHRSQPLSELIYAIMKESDNLYSNALFKKMGQIVYDAPGTWQKGAKAVLSFLADRVGLDTSNLVLMDGDGQSRYNLVSPDQMVEFLKWMKEQFLFFPEFLASFPISGVDGTLRERMSDPSLKGKVRAKTGTMTGISSLAGYAMTSSGELLAFTIFINGFIKPAATYKLSLEDQILLFATQVSR